MNGEVVYLQLNKDYPYWTEKRRVGQMKGGHVAGLVTHLQAGLVQMNLLIDAGLGTLEALADFREDAFWDQPLAIFITHGHIDHHAELMILSEIYCKRRGKLLHDRRPPLNVFCTAETQKYLFATHHYGFTDGNTLRHQPIVAGSPVTYGVFQVTPLAVDHFDGSVIYVIEFGEQKLVIGWDMRRLPFSEIDRLQRSSLALFEATTWQSMAKDTGHVSVQDLTGSGFLRQLGLEFDPAEHKYGVHLVHYSGWEDPWGALTDEQLKEKFDRSFPDLAGIVGVAQRGQLWRWPLSSRQGVNL